jgi:PfaD family protein
MGAAYVLTGSINQACVESGSSDAVREMLAQAEQADVIMAPAADMFEMGVKVQVLKRGTMFAMRAAKLYELYRSHAGLEAIPAAERAQLEKNLFRVPLEEIWSQTRAFWQGRDPAQVERAEKDPRHRMALVFRWYLGLSSRWANAGEPTRKVDYQVWCGPAMGAFNEWAKGSFLEQPRNRRVVTVARNLLYGACVLTRLHILRCQGATVPPEWGHVRPREGETE